MMPYVRRGVLALLLCAIATASGYAQTPAPSPTDAPRAVYVRFDASTASQAQQAVAPNGNVSWSAMPRLALLQSQHRVQTLTRVFRPAGRFEARHRAWGLHRWYRATYAAAASPAVVAQAFRRTAGVEAAAPVHRKHLHGRVPAADPPAVPRPTAASDAPLTSEPEYAKQWHYHNTGQTSGTPDADINLPEAYGTAHAAPNVVVSVVDSGLDLDHPEFAGMLWVNAGEDINENGVFDRTPAADGGDLDGLDNDNNGFVDDVVGYDHADDDPIPATHNPSNRDNSHGTHVAGIIGAKNGNGQFGGSVAGGDGTAASGARLMINQVFSQTVGGFAEALVYAADMGAVISNNSWGYTDPGVVDTPILDAIDYFRANAGGPEAPLTGGIFVNSAGNASSGADYYPSVYGPSFTVSSTEDTDRRSSFSNYGDHVDIAAPGGQFGHDGIWSTVHRDQGGFGSISGTSMAAPHVAGALAVLVSHFPGLTNDEAERLLARSGDDIRPLNSVPLGRRMDLAHALDGFDTVAPAALSDVRAATATPSLEGATLRLTWTASGDDGTVGRATRYDVRYSTAGPIQSDAAFDAATRVPANLVPGPSGTSETLRVDGLPFGADVSIALRAVDAFDNASGLSNSVSVRTPPAPVLELEPAELSLSVAADSTTEVSLKVRNAGASASTLLFRLDGLETASGAKAALLDSARPSADTLNGDAEHVITVAVDASGVEPGTYNETLRLASNAPSAPASSVPVLVSVLEADPLPVDLTGFRVQRSGSGARLLWTTASETNNAGFQVQHRPPGATGFAFAGFVKGAGTTSQPQRYRFALSNLDPGTHTFRLRQVDTDGTADLSDARTLTLQAPRVLSLRLRGANPARSQTAVAFTVSQSGPANVALYNVLGQHVRTVFQGTASVGDERTVRIATDDLPSGMYFVRLSAPTGRRTQQIVVVK